MDLLVSSLHLWCFAQKSLLEPRCYCFYDIAQIRGFAVARSKKRCIYVYISRSSDPKLVLLGQGRVSLRGDYDAKFAEKLFWHLLCTTKTKIHVHWPPSNLKICSIVINYAVRKDLIKFRPKIQSRGGAHKFSFKKLVKEGNNELLLTLFFFLSLFFYCWKNPADNIYRLWQCVAYWHK